MSWRFAQFAGWVLLSCASGSIAAPVIRAQDVEPAIDTPDPEAPKSRRARPKPQEPAPAARTKSKEPPPPPEPPPPVPVQPPEPEPAAAAPAEGDVPVPPPVPAKPGDYAGSNGAARSDDSLASDTAEEPEAQFREQEHREFSVRIDPLNWLLLGRIGVELEMTAWKFISVELIPVFVTSTEPLLLNYSRFDNTLTQHSRGIGPISGASVGAGVWLMGEPFSGYVIRLNFTNYAYTYRAADGGGTFDKVEVTERRLAVFFGSHSRFGPFTIAGGFGLGLELNQNERCGLARGVSDEDGAFRVTGRSSDCKGRQLIALNRNLTETADLNGPLHPFYFEARFSFGVVF